MNNSTNDDLVFQVQLLENTYDRNKVTQTLRKGKSSKDDSFAYTGGKKPKTIFTKTSDKMINEYKEDYENKKRQGVSYYDKASLDASKPVLIDTQFYTDNIEQYKQRLEYLGKLIEAASKEYNDKKDRIDTIDKNVTMERQLATEDPYNEQKYNIEIKELIKEKNKILHETKALDDHIYQLNDERYKRVSGLQKSELKLDTLQKENETKKRHFINSLNSMSLNYIREQTPGESDADYANSIAQQLQPLSDDNIKEAAKYDQLKLLKTNFSKIFDMSNPRRIALVEDVIQMLQDKYDNGIYDANTKWTKIATKLLEIYGYDNSNVNKDSLEQIISQYIVASLTTGNVDDIKIGDWYKDPRPPVLSDNGSVTLLNDLARQYGATKSVDSFKQPSDTGDTKSVESFRITPQVPDPVVPLSDQTMDLAREVKQLAAIEAKTEPEAKTTGRKYAQAKLMITEPKFYVILIKHRGNIFIGVSQTGEIGTYTVKPYFAVLKNGMLLPTSEGKKLDKKSVVRPYDQWSITSDLDPFQLGALGDKYYDIKTGDPKIKNPAREDVLDVEDGEQDIQFDYNDEIVRWRSLNPHHYTLKGKEDTQGRTDFIKSVSTPRIVGAGISIPKHDKIVHFGNVLLMYDRLLRHNMLSIKKKGGGNIEHFKNVKVSDKFVDIITGALNKQNIRDIYHELSEKEQELYNILVQVSNVHKYVNIPKPNIKFLKDRLKIVEGEIEAGNDNLIEELTDILHTMMVVKLITKKEAKEHLQYYMDMNQ